MGKHAVELALKGKTSVMTTIERITNQPYTWSLGSVDLEKVANREKMVPSNFISTDGFSITEKCREYLSPLIEGEAYPDYQKGIPRYTKLRRELASKIINDDFPI